MVSRKLLGSVCAVLLTALAVTATAGDYRIGPGDEIHVLVFGEDDLTRTVPVASDGSVWLPLIGRVAVEGLTIREAEARIHDLYEKDYLKHPQVEVRMKAYRAQSVQLLGAVARPNIYELTGPAQVLDILGRGGGVAERAGRYLLIIRAEDPTQAMAPQKEIEGHSPAGRAVRSQTKPIRVDLQALLKGDLSHNLPVRGGDVLFVPRAEEVYLLGEVQRPGALSFSEDLTLLQAITKAGGFSKVAQEKKVEVIRVEAGEQVKREFNVKRIAAGKEKDFLLKPEDLIVVPESIL